MLGNMNDMDYKGKLLITKPILEDPFFSKSVIYITDYNKEKGTVGFILNKIYTKKLSDLMPGIEADTAVYMGGPVNQDHLFVIHSRPDIIKGGVSISDNYFWSGDYDQIKLSINKNLIGKNEIRFFIGYSGWREGQLENEMKREDWLIYDDPQLNILEWDKNLWKNELIKMDKTNIIWVNSPSNPQLN